MCEKCVDFDKKIAQYQPLASRFSDQAFLDGISELIEQEGSEGSTPPPNSKGKVCGTLDYKAICFPLNPKRKRT
jgi:hypothetical protein